MVMSTGFPVQRDKSRRLPARLAILVCVGMLVGAGRGVTGDLPDELSQLARSHGFTVKGLELVAAEPARTVNGSLYQQIEQLLEDYDHIVLRGPNAGVQRLIVVSRKRAYVAPPEPPPPPSAAQPPGDPQAVNVPTEREGAHHKVSGEVQGNEGQQERVDLLIDTGASFLVLPASIATRLGLPLSAMASRNVQTANGAVEAHIGRIPQLRIGEARFPQVETAFIEDAHLGGASLLGMSVLRGHKVTLDDAEHRLTLTPAK